MERRLMVEMLHIEQMLRLPDVLRATGMSKRTIYRWIGQGHFPEPVSIGPNAVGWPASDVRRWQTARFERAPTSD